MNEWIVDKGRTRATKTDATWPDPEDNELSVDVTGVCFGSGENRVGWNIEISGADPEDYVVIAASTFGTEGATLEDAMRFCDDVYVRIVGHMLGGAAICFATGTR